MPELPEVQTIVNELKPKITGEKIISCIIFREGVIQGEAHNFRTQLKGESFTGVERVGKYILMELSKEKWLVVHLRMTGKFIIQNNGSPLKQHDRVVIQLESGRNLIFNDVRCFGRLEIVNDLRQHKGVQKQGWDPWASDLTAKSLHIKLKNRKNAIKNLLLDQTIISGLGNIYVCEILYREKISPLLAANQLSIKRLSGLIGSMRSILELALVHNGTSISDYKRVDDKSGEFQNFLQVYGKTGEGCKCCGETIVRIRQNQRSTFLCPQCQKN